MERESQYAMQGLIVVGLAACLIAAGIHYLITRRRK